MAETHAARQAGLTFSRIACLRGERLLFEGIDLALGAGGAALVTGPNGAGKSSLLRIAAGLLAPAAGAVERIGRLALVDERAALDGRRSMAEALGFWAALDGAPGEAAAAAMRAMGIEALAQVPVRLLSTGQRRRAALARVIAGGAAIWLLDEPANGLDALARSRLEEAIALHRAAGGIAMVATHQPLALPGAAEIDLRRA